MADTNRVNLTGRMGKDPNMFYTTQGKACTKFSMAVNKWVPEGQDPGEPDWFNVTCWGDVAERVAEKFRRGAAIKVFGSIRVSRFKSKQLVDKMVSAGLASEIAEEIAIATWYEISAASVDLDYAAMRNGKDVPHVEEVSTFDFETGSF